MQQPHEPTETARRQLGELGAMAAKTEADERKILERAEKRLEEVVSRIEELRPQVHASEDAGTEYTDLVSERGSLERVIANAREVLGS